MFNKTLTAAAFAVSMVGGTAAFAAAHAQEMFFAQDMVLPMSATTVELGDFNSPAEGMVKIYDFRLGTMGALLGEQAVTEGANLNLLVPLQTPPLGDIIAVLVNGTEVVGMQQIKVEQ